MASIVVVSAMLIMKAGGGRYLIDDFSLQESEPSYMIVVVKSVTEQLE